VPVISRDDDFFFELGGDSPASLQHVSAVGQEPATRGWRPLYHRTPAALARTLDDGAPPEQHLIVARPPAAQAAAFPVSPAQAGLPFLSQALAPDVLLRTGVPDTDGPLDVGI